MLVTAAVLSLVASMQRALFGCATSANPMRRCVGDCYDTAPSMERLLRLQLLRRFEEMFFASERACRLLGRCPRQLRLPYCLLWHELGALKRQLLASREARATSTFLSAMARQMMPVTTTAAAPPLEGQFRVAAAESAHPVLSRAVTECVQVSAPLTVAFSHLERPRCSSPHAATACRGDVRPLAQDLRMRLGPGVQPHLLQLLVDSEHHGNFIEMVRRWPATWAAPCDTEASCAVSSCLPPPGLRGLRCDARDGLPRVSGSALFLQAPQFVLECFATRGVSTVPALFGGAVTVRYWPCCQRLSWPCTAARGAARVAANA